MKKQLPITVFFAWLLTTTTAFSEPEFPLQVPTIVSHDFPAPLPPVPGLLSSGERTPQESAWTKSESERIAKELSKQKHSFEGVTLAFVLHKNGDITNIKQYRTSGSKQIDAQAAKFLKNQSPLLPFDDRLNETRVVSIYFAEYPHFFLTF